MSDDSTFYFPCFECRRRAFLIRGLCDACAPTLHADHKRMMEAYSAADAQYQAETGRQPLDDYDAFEAWCNQRGLS